MSYNVIEDDPIFYYIYYWSNKEHEEMNKLMEESEVGPTSIDVTDEHDSW
jgi:hypothetical protein